MKHPWEKYVCKEEKRNCGHAWLGLARTLYIRCVYGKYGREIAKCTVIYGVYVRFWPTLGMMPELQQTQGEQWNQRSAKILETPGSL
jgi:hypothetical protein